MSARDYPLTRSAQEHARLAQQAAFWSADAAALFEAAAIGPGQRVADLGCGTPEVADLLAARVGSEGEVQALDSDQALVQAASARRDAPPWLGFAQGDAYATGWPAGGFDAVHARFLAAPAGRLDALLTEMQRLVRPGGSLLLQEPDADSWCVPAAGAAWPRLLALIRAGFRQRGGDFDAGRHLANRLHAAGLREVRVRRVCHTLPADHPYAALPLSFCGSLAALWASAGLAAADEVEALAAAVRGALHASAAAVTTFTLVQAWGHVDR